MATRLTRAFTYVSDCLFGFVVAMATAVPVGLLWRPAAAWTFLIAVMVWSVFASRRASRRLTEPEPVAARMTVRGWADILIALAIFALCLVVLVLSITLLWRR